MSLTKLVMTPWPREGGSWWWGGCCTPPCTPLQMHANAMHRDRSRPSENCKGQNAKIYLSKMRRLIDRANLPRSMRHDFLYVGFICMYITNRQRTAIFLTLDKKSRGVDVSTSCFAYSIAIPVKRPQHDTCEPNAHRNVRGQTQVVVIFKYTDKRHLFNALGWMITFHICSRHTITSGLDMKVPLFMIICAYT